MWHTIFISAHAVFGTLALVSGIVAFERTPRALPTYLVSLAAMLVGLGLAIGSEWGTLAGPVRILFALLAVLGAVVLARGAEAMLLRPTGDDPPSLRYEHALGFTLVALTDAFVVILVLDLGAPGWATATTGAVIAVAGHYALRARTSTHGRIGLITAPPAASPSLAAPTASKPRNHD